MQIQGNNVVVTTTVSGLIPNSTHMAHINIGSCQAQGKVAYALQSLVADGQGSATSKTVINNVTNFSAQKYYINIHEGATADDLAVQEGFDPIACGNI